MRNLVVVSHTVCTHVGGTKNLGDAEAPWDGGEAKHASPVPVLSCYIRPL